MGIELRRRGVGGVVGGFGGHLAGHGDNVEDARDTKAVGRGQLGVDVDVHTRRYDLEADAVEARVVGAGKGGAAAAWRSRQAWRR